MSDPAVDPSPRVSAVDHKQCEAPETMSQAAVSSFFSLEQAEILTSVTPDYESPQVFWIAITIQARCCMCLAFP